MILALDPAIRSPGVAAFHAGKLVACARIKVSKKVNDLGEDERLGERVHIVAGLIGEWFRLGPWTIARSEPLTVIYEWPQIYGRKTRKGDPNDLLKVLAVGAAVAQLYTPTPTIITPTPAQWSHGTSKSTKKGEEWTSQRGAMVWRRLDERERLVTAGANHDVVDAIGLGLHACGRFEPVRVNAGATPD